MDPAMPRPTVDDHAVVNISDAEEAAARESPTSTMDTPATTNQTEIELGRSAFQTPATTNQTEIELGRPAFQTPATIELEIPAANIRRQPSIYRVPECYRRHSPHYFTPAVISFGPFHYDTGDHLRAMEAHKWKLLDQILGSMVTQRTNINEQDLVNAIWCHLTALLQCYTGFEGLWSGDKEYAHILMRRHRIDEIANRVVKDRMQDKLDGHLTEGLVCKMVREGIDEFALLLVKKVDGDEFTRFMIRGDNVARLMVKHSVQYLVRDIARGCLLKSGQDSSRIEELARNMVREGVAEFTCRLVRDGLDAFARLMVRDGVFQISLMVAAARKVATKKYKADNAAADVPLFRFADGWQFQDNDTVFGKKAAKEIWDHIQRDMMLIENQIPMRVLEILLGVLSPLEQLKVPLIAFLLNH